MPRSNRYIVPGHIYHVTHRCHNRKFLLKFARDRTAYMNLLRQRVRQLPLSLLNYDVTSNHVHLLISPDEPESLSVLMQLVAGDMAQAYNLRKGRSGAYWEGRFHSTMIENGKHLWNCMKYIDLNMVRAGVVPHPKLWKWTGYQELMGFRRRYRLIDFDKVLELTGQTSWHDFRENYEAMVEDALKNGELRREPCWTESLAVGGRPFVETLKNQIRNRWRIELLESEEIEGTFALREFGKPYHCFSGGKVESNAPIGAFGFI